MILSKFIDKTLEAAKQSALQIAGDDYADLKEMIPNEDGNEENDHGSSANQQQHSKDDSHQKNTVSNTKGVVFERSGSKADGEKQTNHDFDKKLESIRKYAAQQETDNPERLNREDSPRDATPETGYSEENKATSKAAVEMYSRKDIQKKTKS